MLAKFTSTNLGNKYSNNKLFKGQLRVIRTAMSFEQGESSSHEGHSTPNSQVMNPIL